MGWATLLLGFGMGCASSWVDLWGVCVKGNCKGCDCGFCGCGAGWLGSNCWDKEKYHGNSCRYWGYFWEYG